MLKQKIAKEEIQDISGKLLLTDKTELESERDSLTQKIEQRKKELQDQKVPKAKRQKDPELQDLYTQRDNINSNINEADENNLKSLTKKIQELDVNGEKFGVGVGTTFQVDDGK